MTRGNAVENKWEQNVAIPQFEQAHPVIKVEWLNVQYKDFVTKSMVMNAAGTPPDIWAANGGASTRAYAAVSGMLQDLAPFVRRDKIDLSVYPKVLTTFLSYSGHLVGLPITNIGSFVFYNKDLFQNASVPFPPSNWNDPTWTMEALRSTARKLTTKPGQSDGQYGLTVQNGDLGWAMGAWLWGADAFSADGYAAGYPSRVNFEQPGVQSSYNYFVDLLFKDHVAPTPDDLKAMALSTPPFIAQRVAMQMIGGWYIENLKDTVHFKMGVAAFPHATSNAAAIWPDSFVMAARTKYPDQSWTLLSYLVGPIGVRGFMQAVGGPPANQQLLDQWYPLYPFVPTAELKQAMEGAFAAARMPAVKVFVDFPHIDGVLEPILAPMWQGKAAVLTTLQQVQQAETAALAPNVGKKLCVIGTSFGVCPA